MPEFTNEQLDQSFYYIQKMYHRIKDQIPDDQTRKSRKDLSKRESSIFSTERGKYIHLQDLSSLYETFVKEYEGINHTLSIYNLNVKKGEYKKLLEFWKEFRDDYKKKLSKIDNNSKQIFQQLAKFKELFHINAYMLEDAISRFNDFIKSQDEYSHYLKRIYNFCFNVTNQEEGLVVEEVEKAINHMIMQFGTDTQTIKVLIEDIKANCLLKKNFFSFYDVPDMMLTKTYSNSDYKCCINFLKKVKKRFLILKQKESKESEGKSLPSLNLDDLIPIVLLEEVCMRHKFTSESKIKELESFFLGAKDETTEKMKKLEVSNEYTKEKISNNIIITIIILRLEKFIIHFKLYDFKIKKLLQQFAKDEFKNISEIVETFDKIINITEEDEAFKKFINKFTYFVHSGTNVDYKTLSLTFSSQTQDREEKSNFNQNMILSSPDSLQKEKETGIEDVIQIMNQQTTGFTKKSSSEKVPVKVQLSMSNLSKLEEKEEEILDEEEEDYITRKERERLEKEKKYAELFKTKKGELYDPKKKFGTLDDDYLVFDEKTTTIYPHIKPVEDYHKDIIKKSPSPLKKWFIREHHCETLTGLLIKNMKNQFQMIF